MGSAGTDGMAGLFQVSLGEVKVAGEDGARLIGVFEQSVYPGGVTSFSVVATMAAAAACVVVVSASLVCAAVLLLFCCCLLIILADSWLFTLLCRALSPAVEHQKLLAYPTQTSLCLNVAWLFCFNDGNILHLCRPQASPSDSLSQW